MAGGDCAIQCHGRCGDVRAGAVIDRAASDGDRVEKRGRVDVHRTRTTRHITNDDRAEAVREFTNLGRIQVERPHGCIAQADRAARRGRPQRQRARSGEHVVARVGGDRHRIRLDVDAAATDAYVDVGHVKRSSIVDGEVAAVGGDVGIDVDEIVRGRKDDVKRTARCSDRRINGNGAARREQQGGPGRGAHGDGVLDRDRPV